MQYAAAATILRADPDKVRRADTAFIRRDRLTAEKAAAENVKRVIKAPTGELSPQLIAAFMEMKTVWHPIGV